MKRNLSLILFVAIGTPGCYFDLNGEPEPVPTFDAGASSDAGPRADSGWDFDGGFGFDAPEEPGTNSLNVTDPAMSGAIGAVSTAPDGEFYVFGSSGGEGYINLDLRSRSETGVIMNLLSLENTSSMEIGQTYRATEYSASSLYVQVVGCSGPNDGNWYVDTFADEVTVDVREGPEEGSAEIVYNVAFSNGDTVEGSFVMPLN